MGDVVSHLVLQSYPLPTDHKPFGGYALRGVDADEVGAGGMFL